MQGLPDQRFVQQPPPNMQRTIVPPINTTGMAMNPPPNMIMSPRDTIPHQQMKPMMESIHHNIPTAESMYAPIPAELLQKQFIQQGQYGQLPPQFQGQLPPQFQGQMQGQLPPGVISARGISPNGYPGVQQMVSSQQQFFPPNMMPVSPTNGNFVYTRRIIDPKSHNVVA